MVSATLGRRLPMPADPSGTAIRTAAKALVGRRLDLHVEGLEHVPFDGPVLIAARHFHHLCDGCAILATVPRPVHILVALDWLQNRAGRAAMEKACRAAGWPVVLRPHGPSGDIDELGAARVFRAAARDSLALFAAGKVLLVFPEGYPNIDPGYTPKQGDDEFLPFQPGVVRLASLAATRGLSVPIVPAGLSYRRANRWQVTLRFGEPLILVDRTQEAAILRTLEARVHVLSTDR
jgi:1-acyl-sn-glycerol-3-phosphate acyltransferase